MCITCSSGRQAHMSDSHMHTLYCSFVICVGSDACQAELCTNSGSKDLYYPIKWCVSHTQTHTHTGFVLCDQMMRVAMMLVTSIQQCPILFGSHPYCVTVLLMLCKHISSVCISYTALFSMKYGCSDTLLCLGNHHLLGNVEAGIMGKRSSFTSVVSNKSTRFWVLISVAAVVNLSCTQRVPIDAKQSDFGHMTAQRSSM